MVIRGGGRRCDDVNGGYLAAMYCGKGRDRRFVGCVVWSRIG